MYSNMSKEEVFLKHVVNDQRSFKVEIFEKALRVISNPSKGVTVDQERKDKFEAMIKKIKDIKNEIDEEDVRVKNIV